MTLRLLKSRVEARDRLVHQVEQAKSHLHDEVVAALARGDRDAAAVAARRHDAQLHELAENLRIYQAELHAQADELAAATARGEQMLSRFATLFAAMPIGAMLVGINGELFEFNTQAARLFGFEPHGRSVRFLHRLIEPDHYQSRVRPAFHEARDGGASVCDDVVFLGEAGRRFVGELHIACMPGAADAPPQFCCTVTDRTEHSANLQALQRSAEALRQSEAFLGDTARLAQIGGWELVLHPRTLRWSPQLRALFAVGDRVEATLEATLARCTPHDRAVFATAVAGAERGEPFEIELDMTSARGRRMRMLAAGRAELVQGVVQRVHGVFQDISVQAEARRRIDDLTERLSLANDAGGIGIFDWDLDHGALVFDSRLCRLLGLPGAGPQQHQGDLRWRLGEHLHPDDARLFADAIDRALADQDPLNLELRRSPPHLEGECWLHVTGRAHRDAAGRVHRFVGCAWDSSPEHESARLRAAKESAETASRAKSAFLSRMSHELRTPLNAILGFSQLMRLEAEAGDLTLKPHRVALIETAARHLLDLVNEVLDVTRVESGHVEMQLVALPLHEVLAEALPLVQGLASELGVTLHDHLAEGGAMHRVLGDRLRLREVLINLLSNAVKYNRPGGRVDIRVGAPGDGLVPLVVCDTGVGLDEQQLAGMFQPFSRLGAEASSIEGTGMGLFVSLRFVELMGGRIEVASRPGEGTSFTVQLKVAEGPAS